MQYEGTKWILWNKSLIIYPAEGISCSSLQLLPLNNISFSSDLLGDLFEWPVSVKVSWMNSFARSIHFLQKQVSICSAA